MAGEHTIHCGVPRAGKRAPSKRERELFLWGPRRNVHLDIDDITSPIACALPLRSRDLLDIAAYVSAADQSVSRGAETGEDLGRKWRRQLRFRIGVRDHEFWSAADTKVLLAEALGFASDDTYEFDFFGAKDLPHDDPFLDIKQDPAAWYRVERVLAFSGGLDSFAGAVECTLGEAHQVALVSHRAATKLDPIQRRLAASLQAQLDMHRPGLRAHHFSVGLTRSAELDQERTQRTRSFLFAALGGVIARALGCSSLSFYENGVVSLNLSVAEQALGARATRTTHPRTLLLYQRLLSAVFERTFQIDNPYLWKTKADIVRVIAKHGCSHLLRDTISCGHVIGITKTVTHCGKCSQCIDRRFGILAAGAESDEPSSIYGIDLFTKARQNADEQTMLESYVRRAREVDRMDALTFHTRFGEVARVLNALPGTSDENAARIFSLYRQHASEVVSVLKDQVARGAAAIVTGTVEPKSLLAMLVGDGTSSVAGQQPAARGTNQSSQEATRPNGRRDKRARQIPIRILHVSDTHFSRRWDQDAVLAKLAEDVRTLREKNGLPPDLLVWTGDIAHRGLEAEYAQAETWLTEELLPAAGLTQERVVLVPGNHDIDRTRVRISGQSLRDRLLKDCNQDIIADLIDNENDRSPLFQSLQAYLAFAGRVEKHRPNARDPWSVARFDIRGKTVHVAALCSTWASYADEEEGRLLIGRAQLQRLLPLQRNDDLVISAMHHPFNYLAEFDRNEISEELSRRSDLILRGHLHSPGLALIRQPHTSTVELAAGASYVNSRYPNSYHIIECDLSANAIRVHFRVWDNHDWIANRNAFGGATPEGFAELPMPPRPARPSASSPRKPKNRTP